MIRPLNVLTAACLCMVSLQTFAQKAEPLIFPESGNDRAACIGTMDAGTIINITPLGAQSNDLSGSPIVLCYGDQILINHAGDSDLTGDPDPGTRPGIGYAYYTCQPTATGPEIAQLTADGCLTDMPMASQGVWVARGNEEGDVVFFNNGNLQKQFFNGRPDIMYFAPITITNFEATPPSFDDGTCLNVNTSEAFSVLYLNEIELTGFSTPDENSLSGMFSLAGGYPEFDNSVNYVVTLTKLDDPSVTGIIDASITHGGTTTFSVPEEGTYALTVIDPKGCSKEFIVNIPNVNPVQLCIADTSVRSRDNFCVPITVADFVNVATVSMTIAWDPSVIEFASINNINPAFGNNFGFDDTRGAEGIIPILFFDLSSFNTINLPDSAIMFEICFTAIGKPGDQTDIRFLDEPSPISITDLDDDLSVVLKPGSVVITNPMDLALFYTACGNASGTADLTVQVYGGVDPYNYQVVVSSTNAIYDSGSLPTGTGGWQNVPADIYEIVITDATGNFSVINVDLSLAPLQVDTLIFDPSCMGSADGSIEVTDVNGGQGPYTTIWSGPGISKYGTFLIQDLQAGSYNLIVQDANRCTDTLDIELVEGGLDIMIATQPPVCSGERGDITVTVPGAGNEVYELTWYNSDSSMTRTITGPSPLVISNLLADTYTIALSNGACDVVRYAPLIAQKTITIALDTANSRLTTSCGGDRDGRLDINVSADRNQSAFQFFWDQVTQDSGVVTIQGSMDHTFVTDLPGGTYTLRVEDVQGCEATESFTIVEAKPLNVNPQALQQFITQPDCPDGTNGRIDLGFADGAIGGTPFPSGASYRYRWYDITNGNILINDRSSQIRDLMAGTYGVYLEDANGCNDSTTLVLNPGPTINIVLDMENICRGDSVAALSVTGDIDGNTISWSNGENTSSISNLREGKYYVTVTEDACNSIDSFEIIDPRIDVRVNLPMQFSVTSLCNEPDTGLIFNLQIDYNGRMGNDFIWPSLDTMTAVNFITVTESGDYPFIVLDRVTGCIVYDSVVTAQFPEKINLAIDTTHVSCSGDQDGSIVVTPSGRSGMFDFSWASGFSVNNASESSVTNLAPGIYELTVTESTDSNCRVPLSIEIREPDPLTLTVDSTFTRDIRCFGEDNGQIGLIWEGGNQDAAPTIVWSAGAASNTLSATDLAAGAYNIVLTDSRGCTDMVDVTIAEPPQLFATVPTPAEPACNGFQTTVNVTNASGGTGSNYTFTVDNGPPQPLNTPYPTFAGEYIVSIFDESGCRVDTTITITEPAAIDVDLGPDVAVALGDSFQLNPLVIGPSTIDSYLWSPEELLSCNNCLDPYVNPIEDQLIELTVFDINGCEGQDQLRITVDKARLVYIPNGFTPNGDGVNEKWRVFTGPGVRSILSVHVFDRWGNLVFENPNPEPPNSDGTSGWDGRVGGSLVHAGVYVYLVEIEFIDGKIFTYRGDVTLVP